MIEYYAMMDTRTGKYPKHKSKEQTTRPTLLYSKKSGCLSKSQGYTEEEWKNFTLVTFFVKDIFEESP